MREAICTTVGCGRHATLGMMDAFEVEPSAPSATEKCDGCAIEYLRADPTCHYQVWTIGFGPWDLRPRRVCIAGGPSVGKTTLSATLGMPVRHTDDLIGQFEWSPLSEHVAREWLAAAGAWVVEGVRVVHALRKWLEANAKGVPCDVVCWLSESHIELERGQATLAKQCATIWRQIRPQLEARGVRIVESAASLRAELGLEHAV